MIGAIIGDIIGSVYEFDNCRSTKFPLFSEQSMFTDDTVMSVATAQKLLVCGSYATLYREYYRSYPHCSYGNSFRHWASTPGAPPYNSFGNGSAMRVSPVGYAFDTLEETLAEAKESAFVSHNHLEGIKGAQATAASIFLARTGASKKEIKEYVADAFHYDLNRTLKTLQRSYQFNEICQETVPESIFVFLVSDGFEDAIRKAVSIGGDTDTVACIVGGIAQAFYEKIPRSILRETKTRLTLDLWAVTEKFCHRFCRSLDLS